MTDTARDGAGIARAEDGRVVFVEGALVGEVVEAAVVREERRWSRARLQRIIEASPPTVWRCRVATDSRAVAAATYCTSIAIIGLP